MRGVTALAQEMGIGEYISTRTPHAGSDEAKLEQAMLGQFQPALPMRGVTREDGLQAAMGAISTRTPHAGSDAAIRTATS